ncbi:response regulator [Pararobbsia silviterrae]|uniref:Response regulator n=1 Tax=Pararobbsia silviterrae TaxID=1792498 RepID=A0A494XFI6_9BURK|nr:response regulator [Pararobbsia silviterrae]RKP49567.1 response regulator [Pararobbsia silviterrae]
MSHAVVHSAPAHRPCVLMVDDEYELLETWSLLLEIQGFSVLIAPDAAEGLKLAKANLPSVVITDYRMPGIDGLEFCRQMKSNESTRHFPIIMWTGTPMRADAALFERLAIKPVALKALLELMRDVLH